MDLPQPLEPRVVDDLLLGRFALGQSDRGSEGDVSVNGVVTEAFALEVFHGGDGGRGMGHEGFGDYSSSKFGIMAAT